MGIIVPTVLASTPEEYKSAFEKIHTFAKRVHVDLSDISIAPTQTVAVDQIWWPQGWEVDIHAMVSDPSLYFEPLIALHPHMVIFHAEVKTDLIPIFQKLKAAGIKAGVSLLRPTVPSDVSDSISAADHVMIFSGNLGQYGGTASLMQLEKIRLIKEINAGAEIGWDGGITLENVFSLVQGGVEVFNVGGAIQKAADAPATYEALVKEINRQGVM